MSSKYKIGDQTELYFVTYATVGWVDVFARAVYRDIFIQSLNHCSEHKGLNVYAWVLMPNHIHAITCTERSRSVGTRDKPIESTMRDHKRHTSDEIHKALKYEAESRREWMLPIFTAAGSALSHNRGFQLWQQDYHPILLSSRELVLQRLHYTHYNPVRAGFVEEPQHWIYSSAVAYPGGHSIMPGLQILEL